ncbi:Phage integrase, N-terminal SAM-like domain [Thalassovita litoralis]|uniref:Phage integrase, N-terminal SAM-like domain n=1 Tax=Thalassovita litoralis TaxID=1010611 RepID=A0A521FV37_9RHOB|nr:Phage integrase, N-terminal SAM-like domain [Thalassovita litoralis]
MTEERVSPLRQRMIEDMNIRGLGEKTQKAHIRNVKHFATFLGRSPDTATPEELRSYQLKMTKDGVSASTFNVRIISLRFFFGVTCGREEMKRYMQFHRKPRKLPVVLSVEEVADLLAAVPGPGLKYRAALGISYGAGFRGLSTRAVISWLVLLRSGPHRKTFRIAALRCVVASNSRFFSQQTLMFSVLRKVTT